MTIHRGDIRRTINTCCFVHLTFLFYQIRLNTGPILQKWFISAHAFNNNY
jgi:hypothetical protein